MKRISAKAWREYVDAHARIRTTARDELVAFFDSLPWETDRPGAIRLLVDKAIEIANLYGLADATLSAGFYDELMLSYGVALPPADIALPPTTFVADDVLTAIAKAVSVETARALTGGVVAGHVKRAGIETMKSAAMRDGAMWAWVCIGDTCAFCRVLGSNGFQYASKNVRNGRHAEHIHDNCDCQFVAKPEGEALEIDGYDPVALTHEYSHSEGFSSRDRINAMRRADYTPEFAEQRNARRRELYAAAQQEQADNQD